MASTKDILFSVGGRELLTPLDDVSPDNGPIQQVTKHDSLQGLQGGKAGQRYHLTKDQFDAINAVLTASASNPFITKKDASAIQDNNTSSVTTWSSEKIVEFITDLLSKFTPVNPPVGGVGDTLPNKLPFTLARRPY